VQERDGLVNNDPLFGPNCFAPVIFAREHVLIAKKTGPKTFRPEKFRVFKISMLKFSVPGNFDRKIFWFFKFRTGKKFPKTPIPGDLVHQIGAIIPLSVLPADRY